MTESNAGPAGDCVPVAALLLTGPHLSREASAKPDIPRSADPYRNQDPGHSRLPARVRAPDPECASRRPIAAPLFRPIAARSPRTNHDSCDKRIERHSPFFTSIVLVRPAGLAPPALAEQV